MALVTEVLPVDPLLTALAWIPDVLILNPVSAGGSTSCAGP